MPSDWSATCHSHESHCLPSTAATNGAALKAEPLTPRRLLGVTRLLLLLLSRPILTLVPLRPLVPVGPLASASLVLHRNRAQEWSGLRLAAQ